MANMKMALRHTGLQVEDSDAHGLGSIFVVHCDILEALTLDPFTHVYSFDVGFPPDTQRQIARMFNASTFVAWLVSFQSPAKILHQYGYMVEFLDQLTTKMCGKYITRVAFFTFAWCRWWWLGIVKCFQVKRVTFYFIFLISRFRGAPRSLFL